MNIKEYYQVISNNINQLELSRTYDNKSPYSDKPYFYKKLKQLRSSLRNLDLVTFIKPQIDKLRKTALFITDKDEDYFTNSDDTNILSTVSEIKTGIDYIMKYVKLNEVELNSSIISIKLPEVHGFDDLSRVANDLKKAIEIPVTDQNNGGKVEILSAEKGSIWLTVSLGSGEATYLVSSICWAAAVVRKKAVDVKLFEMHAKTLDMPADALQTVISAQDALLANIVSNEAEAIASKHFSEPTPETIARLKLSISTVSALIDKGARILPASSDTELQRFFPDYNQLSIIESSIKQIENNND